MDLKEQFKAITNIKNSSDLKYKSLSENYLLHFINNLLITRSSFNSLELFQINYKVSGTYLMYSIVNNKLNFCYIGESRNLISRFKQHVNGFKTSKERFYYKMRSKVEGIADINFLILDEIDNQNDRLMKETYYIYSTKSKFYSLNTKLVNRKLKCPNGHGMVKSFLNYEKDTEKLKLIIYGKCTNKKCKETFVIK
ncbi:GIY-YIG nuclease family protein [Spiroplasma endosymbiont of Cantharis rufa]|uniref:GIY-YIG nuclease family protein n=1 Tax=Spiroplasma endosymbiont of Cantharis rufa TaxID=3066279 RepID=UPI0030CC4F8F